MSPGFDNVVSAKVRVDAETVAAPHVLPVADVPPAVALTVVLAVSNATFQLNAL